MQLGGRVSARAALCALVWCAASARAEVRLLRIDTARDASGTRIELRTDGATPTTQPFRLSAPSRLVLDLPGVVNGTGQERFEVGGSDVLRVRLGRHDGFLRLVLDLAPGSSGAPRIERFATSLALAFGDARLPAVGAEPPPAPAAAPLEKPAAPAAETPPSAASQWVRIYGVELQAGSEHDRVLVFAEHALEAELVTLDADTVELRLPGATLEPSAARRIEPDVGGAVSEVVAFAPLSKGAPEVRIQIQRSPGVEPTLSSRGAILAVEFPVPEGARNTGITLSFVDTELAEVVRDVAKATGASFVFDDRLQGRVTVSVVSRVTPAEAIQILHAALLSKGFAAVPSPGGFWRILPAGDASGSSPFLTTPPDERRVAPITTLVQLHSASARDLVANLERFSGGELIAAAYEPTNSVILAGSEGSVQRYLALVRALDDAEAEELVVVALRHRDAGELAEILRGTAPPQRDDPTGQRRTRFEVWADERSNSVLMRAPPKRLAELRAWLEGLDHPPESQGNIRVIHPLNADVKKLAETLQKLAAGDARASLASGGGAGQELAGRGFHVAVHESTGALLVQGDAETQAIISEVVDEIDRRPPGIAVDLLVLEVTTAKSLALGFDAFIPFGDASDPNETFGGAVSVQSAIGGVFKPITDAGGGFFRYARAPLVIPIIGPGGIPTELIVPRDIVQVTAAEGNATARTLLRPHLVGISGEEHELVAGDNVPVLVGATKAAGDTTVSDPLTITNNIERKDIGTILHVKPTAGQEGDVRIELEVEVSRLRTDASIASNLGPVIEQRKLSAVTRLEHGQVAVLGMVLDDTDVETDHGVPFLKDIPILGWYARSTTTEHMKRSLVIAVQAGIERTLEQRVADTVRHRLSFERTLARRGQLAMGEREGYALLVTTRSNEVEARGVASALEGTGARSPRVVAWEWDGEPRYDVYVGGYATLSQAGAAAEPLVAEGWKPEVVALPPQLSVPAKQE
jgi:general secretion pathway protein D